MKTENDSLDKMQEKLLKALENINLMLYRLDKKYSSYNLMIKFMTVPNIYKNYKPIFIVNKNLANEITK
jgi:hypothetical protein